MPHRCSVIKLTRDTTKNPMWNATRFVGMAGEKTDMEWMNEASGMEEAKHASASEGKAKGKSTRARLWSGVLRS